MMPAMPPGGGGPPPMGPDAGGAPPPQGALGQAQQGEMGKGLQQKVILTVQQVQAMLQVIGQLPGVNKEMFSKGVQALGIGFKMVSEAMPQQGGAGMGAPDMGGAPPGPPLGGSGGPPPGMGGP